MGNSHTMAAVAQNVNPKTAGLGATATTVASGSAGSKDSSESVITTNKITTVTSGTTITKSTLEPTIATAPTAAAPPSERVPSFFPLVRKGCEEVSLELFACLGEATPGDETQAIEKISECESNFQAYERCFNESIASGKTKRPLVKFRYEDTDEDLFVD